MYYTYVLHSQRDGHWHTGAASDHRARVRDHQEGRVRSTRGRRPFELAYYEACLSPADAFRRERYLKTGRGKRYLRQRLKVWLNSVSSKKLERH
ncbi:MAG: GIY-YIG nuclease family protein [Acidobacteria bacterium]|nr:GIY-YIG nuclease family protein [Acidobacteriota bacterium]